MLAAFVAFPAAALQAETLTERPHWSLEVKGGLFVPDIDNWSTYYGRRDTSDYGGSLAYKIFRQLEVGIEGGFIRDKGKGFAPAHSAMAGSPVYAGSVTYELYPLNVFVLARGIFSDQQWLIPYVGGGWTRMFYKEEVQYQSTARGSVDGFHARAGIQLLLDGLDPSAANSFYLDYGVHHTYLFLEAEHIRASIDTVSSGSVNLGGTSWLAGLLFEF